MKKRYSNGSRNTYSDFLTVLLIIVIIAILALVAFFGYKAVSKKSTEVSSQEAYESFQNSVKNNKPTKVENKVENEEVNNEVENIVTNETENETGGGSLTEIIEQNQITQHPSGGETQPPSTPNVEKQYYQGYEIKGSISIPKTKINYVVLDKVTTKSLKAAPAILDIVGCSSISGTIKELNVPGTNALILGHNYRNGLFFSDNDKLDVGDRIIITDATGLDVTYYIYKKYYTDANDASFMERELDPNVREITLQTCNDDSSQRLILWAKDQQP